MKLRTRRWLLGTLCAALLTVGSIAQLRLSLAEQERKRVEQEERMFQTIDRVKTQAEIARMVRIQPRNDSRASR